MGVLIQYRHVTGTWRDCTGDKIRPASNSIPVLGWQMGEGLYAEHADSHREACDCLNPLAHFEL